MEQKLQKFNSLKSKDGFLYKKSPKLLVGYQRRFFQIRDNGQYIAYFKKQPKADEQPAGILPISQIQIKSEKDIFILQYLDRDFILKASSAQEQKEWVDCLSFLKEYNIEFSSQELQQDRNMSWRFETLDNETKNRIQIEAQKQENERNQSFIQEQNINMQKAKGIYQYLESIDQSCITQGFLLKKKQNFVEKLQKAKQRWLFLVSDNQKQFDVDLLPPFMNANTIYYYDSKQNETKQLGEIQIANILEIEQHEMQIGDNSIIKNILGLNYNYGFYIKINKENQEIQYHFYSESIQQIDNWVKQIKQSIQSVKNNTKDYINKQRDEILYEQTLEIKENSLTGQKKKWQTKQFVLKRKVLTWFSKDSNVPEDYICIIDINSCEIQPNKTQTFKIVTSNQNIQFKFKAISQIYCNTWVNAINKLMQNGNASAEEIIQIEKVQNVDVMNSTGAINNSFSSKKSEDIIDLKQRYQLAQQNIQNRKRDSQIVNQSSIQVKKSIWDCCFFWRKKEKDNELNQKIIKF